MHFRLRAPRHALLLPLLFAAGLLLAEPQTAKAQQLDSTQVARFQLADALMRAAQYDRAIVLLEDLYARTPGTLVFYAKLKEAYESVKRYDEAIALVDDMIERERSPMLLSEKARLLYLKGDEEAAFEAWDAAMEAAPRDPMAYRMAFQSLIEIRLFDRATAVILRARERLQEADLFRPELAYLYSLSGKHTEAVAEYIALLRDNEQQYTFVRSRLARFTEQEEALRASINGAARAVREAPLNRAYRELLGWLLVEAKEYGQALDTYRAIDRLEKEQGQVLLGFAQMALDDGAYDVAAEAFAEVLSRYPDAPVAPTALVNIGRLHETWAEALGERAVDEAATTLPALHYQEALETYRGFLARYPNHPLYADVLQRTGRLLQDVFLRLDEAEQVLLEVTTRYPNTPAADDAAFNLARAALLRDDLTGARARLASLVDRLRTGELAERARFEQALLHFYTGEFDAAQELVAVMDVNTSTDVANDAIALKVLLMENRGPDSLHTPLRTFARAQLLVRQRRPTAALDTLRHLAERWGQHPLADDAHYLRAEALRASGRPSEAFALFAELPLLYPTSFLADRSLFAAAEMQEHLLDDPAQALGLYTRLLADYPGSIFAAEARERIRRLRSDGA